MMKNPEREGPPIVTCPHCTARVPGGEFCGNCGAHLATGSRRRSHAYAAVPNQRVAQLAIVSTLFPHLAHRRGGPFRIAIAAGGALVAMLAALHLIAPATVAAVFLLPVLYLMYLYEVEVYEDEPWLVVGATMVLGALLGLVFANLAGASLSQQLLRQDRESAFVLSAIAIPVVAQLLMLAGPSFLYTFRARFSEPLDGVTFGAASGLGFSLATSLTAFWPLIAGPLVASGSPVDWAVRLTRAGLLVALINACTTALIAAALWLHRLDTRRGRRPVTSSVLGALVVALAAQLLAGVVGATVGDLVSGFILLAIIAAALLLYIRVVIHDALLVEGAEHAGRALAEQSDVIGPEAPCPECHRLVPTMRFCPACGAARAAGSKQGRARLARGV